MLSATFCWDLNENWCSVKFFSLFITLNWIRMDSLLFPVTIFTLELGLWTVVVQKIQLTWKSTQLSVHIWDRIVFRHWLKHQKGPQELSELHQEYETTKRLQLEGLPSSNREQQEPSPVKCWVQRLENPKEGQHSHSSLCDKESEKAAKRSQSSCDLKLGRRFKFQPNNDKTQRKPTLRVALRVLENPSQCSDLNPLNSNL